MIFQTTERHHLQAIKFLVSVCALPIQQQKLLLSTLGGCGLPNPTILILVDCGGNYQYTYYLTMNKDLIISGPEVLKERLSVQLSQSMMNGYIRLLNLKIPPTQQQMEEAVQAFRTRPRSVVPNSISAWQAKAVAHDSQPIWSRNIRRCSLTTINAMPDGQQKTIILTAWENNANFNRYSPFILALAQAMGLTF